MTAGPADRDLRIWEHLVAAALKVAADPLTLKTGRLVGNARARLVVLPLGHRHQASPFMALRALGDRWERIPMDEREGHAGVLERLAQACAEALAEPEPRRRADIHD